MSGYSDQEIKAIADANGWMPIYSGDIPKDVVLKPDDHWDHCISAYHCLARVCARKVDGVWELA